MKTNQSEDQQETNGDKTQIEEKDDTFGEINCLLDDHVTCESRSSDDSANHRVTGYHENSNRKTTIDHVKNYQITSRETNSRMGNNHVISSQDDVKHRRAQHGANIVNGNHSLKKPQPITLS
jgi:hypothetical protein